MLKSTSLSELKEVGFSYITAITRAQIETLINRGLLEYGLFDTTLCEVMQDGVRYIYRRNPQRANEIQRARQNKRESLEKLVSGKNVYLAEHKKGSFEKALRDITKKIKGLSLENWLSASMEEETPRVLRLLVDEEKLQEQSRLDRCYVLKTD